MEALEDRIAETVEDHGGKQPISFRKRLYIGLWYLAHKDTYKEISVKFDVAESKAHEAVFSVIKALNSIKDDVIRWPSEHEMILEEKHFLDRSKIPGTIGCIDGTHIKIQSPPKKDQHDYVDRHQQHSYNLTAVCDHNYRFTFVSAGFPGSLHDQRALRLSDLWDFINSEQDSQIFPSGYYHILGDSAYKLMEHLLVPFKNNGRLNIQQKRFNKELSRARIVIENAFGWLKNRFRRLKFVHAHTEKVPLIVTACCVLHNFSLRFTQYEEYYVLIGEEPSSAVEEYEEQMTRANVDLSPSAKGNAKRDRLTSQL